MKPHGKCFYVCLSLWQNWHAPFVWFFRRDDTNPLQQNLHKLFNTVMALPAAWSVSSIFFTILWTYFSFSLAAVGFQESRKITKETCMGVRKLLKKKWWEMGSVWYQLINELWPQDSEEFLMHPLKKHVCMGRHYQFFFFSFF